MSFILLFAWRPSPFFIGGKKRSIPVSEPDREARTRGLIVVRRGSAARFPHPLARRPGPTGDLEHTRD